MYCGSNYPSFEDLEVHLAKEEFKSVSYKREKEK